MKHASGKILLVRDVLVNLDKRQKRLGSKGKGSVLTFWLGSRINKKTEDNDPRVDTVLHLTECEIEDLIH